MALVATLSSAVTEPMSSTVPPRLGETTDERTRAMSGRHARTALGIVLVGAWATALGLGSEEARLLALLVGFVAVVAALAGPWSLGFWRLVQPSLFAGPERSTAPARHDVAIAAD